MKFRHQGVRIRRSRELSALGWLAGDGSKILSQDGGPRVHQKREVLLVSGLSFGLESLYSRGNFVSGSDGIGQAKWARTTAGERSPECTCQALETTANWAGNRAMGTANSGGRFNKFDVSVLGSGMGFGHDGTSRWRDKIVGEGMTHSGSIQRCAAGLQCPLMVGCRISNRGLKRTAVTDIKPT